MTASTKALKEIEKKGAKVKEYEIGMTFGVSMEVSDPMSGLKNWIKPTVKSGMTFDGMPTTQQVENGYKLVARDINNQMKEEIEEFLRMLQG